MDLSKKEKVISAYRQGGSGYFTRDQVTMLQSMLGIDYEDATEIANFITSLLVSVEFYVDARKKVSRDSDEQEKLRDIAKLAKQLHRLLSHDKPAIESLLSRHRHSERGKGMTFDEIKEIGHRPKELLLNLQILAEQATRQANDDEEFARVRMLVPHVNSKDPEIQIATRMLWPELFGIWTGIGKRKLAKTPNGPTPAS